MRAWPANRVMGPRQWQSWLSLLAANCPVHKTDSAPALCAPGRSSLSQAQTSSAARRFGLIPKWLATRKWVLHTFTTSTVTSFEMPVLTRTGKIHWVLNKHIAGLIPVGFTRTGLPEASWKVEGEYVCAAINDNTRPHSTERTLHSTLQLSKRRISLQRTGQTWCWWWSWICVVIPHHMLCVIFDSVCFSICR